MRPVHTPPTSHSFGHLPYKGGDYLRFPFAWELSAVYRLTEGFQQQMIPGP